jgi:D-alanyl-lipoteichoic acid acyltransferase DltB (MBOAT superfamily)
MKGGWGGVDVWLLGIGFGFLLFFDFAGYSQMVIGIARIFGIRVAENFDRPFLSPTPSIFWTRWHMSLSFWIRDYLFNPLAAAGRRYSWWPYVVLIISMTFFGLWHGAKWTSLFMGVPRFDISDAPVRPAYETTILYPTATKFGSFSIVGNYVFAGFSRVYHFSRR